MRIKSGIALRRAGKDEFTTKEARDLAMEESLKKGYFCCPQQREWPSLCYFFTWYVARHRHCGFCGGILEENTITGFAYRFNNLTEGEAYRKISSLLSMGYTVSFSFEDNLLLLETFKLKKWACNINEKGKL